MEMVYGMHLFISITERERERERETERRRDGARETGRERRREIEREVALVFFELNENLGRIVKYLY